MPTALVIGGPGVISTHTIAGLLEQGWQVSLFSRASQTAGEVDPLVDFHRGDRHTPGALEDIFDSVRPDVVLDFVGYVKEDAEQVVKMARGRTGQVIFVSTVDVYGYPLTRLPMREDDPWQPQTISPYAARKRECEAVLRAAHEAGDFPVTIARPTYSFGPRFLLSALDRAAGPHLLYRLKERMPILSPGDGAALIHASSAVNTGRVIAALAGEERAFGRDYTAGQPGALLYDDYIRMLAACVGEEPLLVHVPTDVILSFQDPGMADNLLAELTRFHLYWSLERFCGDFPGFAFRPRQEAAQAAVDWNFAQGLVRYEERVDDRIITRWQAAMRHF